LLVGDLIAMPRPTRTPLEPTNDVLTNATNSAIRPGGIGLGYLMPERQRAGNPEGIIGIENRDPRKANPYSGYPGSMVSGRKPRAGSIFLDTCTLY
jgi:hypothetical protein